MKNLSHDRKVLYNLVIAACEGKIDEKQAKARIGKVHQARWLTLASRVVRLWMSVPSHLGSYVCEVLDRLVNFIIHVYFKVGFIIVITLIFITLVYETIFT